MPSASSCSSARQLPWRRASFSALSGLVLAAPGLRGGAAPREGNGGAEGIVYLETFDDWTDEEDNTSIETEEDYTAWIDNLNYRTEYQGE